MGQAANSASTKYLRTPHKGSPDDPPGVYPQDSTTTDVPTDAISEDSDSDDQPPHAVPSALRHPNSIICDPQAMLKLMVDTWEPILAR